MGLTLVEYVSYLLAVVISARLLLGKTHYAIVKYNYLAMAVILSSFGKPLHLFLMVWCVAFALLFLLLPTCSSSTSVKWPSMTRTHYRHRDYQQLFSTILDVFVVVSNVMAVRGTFVNEASSSC